MYRIQEVTGMRTAAKQIALEQPTQQQPSPLPTTDRKD